jgi:hypothetical protein
MNFWTRYFTLSGPSGLVQLSKNAIVFVRCWRHDFRLLKSNLDLRVNARVGYWFLLCFIWQRVAEVYDLVAGKLIQERDAVRLAPCQQLAAHELRLVVAEPVGFAEA